MPSGYQYPPELIAKAQELRDDGASLRAIAAKLNICRKTLTYHLKAKPVYGGLWGQEGRSGRPTESNSDKPPVAISPQAAVGVNAPEPDVWGRYVSNTLPDTVLVIPDLQAPYQHPDALSFLSMVAQRYQPDLVVGIGDEVDFSFLSDHKKVVEIDNPVPELEQAITFMAELFKLFPQALALTSNHVHGRLKNARQNGRLPASMIRNWREIIQAPKGWEWYEEVRLGNYMFRHGDNWPKLNGMQLLRATPDKYGQHFNIVHGHIHSEHGIKAVERVGDDDYYAAYTGCLINPRCKAFDYTKAPNNKLGCLVIVKGVPHRLPMRLDNIGRFTGKL